METVEFASEMTKGQIMDEIAKLRRTKEVQSYLAFEHALLLRRIKEEMVGG
jgi:hypothetical protein